MQDEEDRGNRAKKRKKVSWKRLDCQDELHKSTTCNKFATLTPGDEEPDFDEDKTGIGFNCTKRKVNMRENIDMLVKVQESPVGGCAKNSSDAQPAIARTRS